MIYCFLIAVSIDVTSVGKVYAIVYCISITHS
jgi:hypothetical protein